MASTKVSLWTLLLFFLFVTLAAKSDGEREEPWAALTSFITSLTNGSNSPGPWNLSSDPCRDNWQGVTCDNSSSLKNVSLDGFQLPGTFNPSSLCNVASVAATLTVISLKDNSLRGEGIEEIANCMQLTRLYLGGNRFSGGVPGSFSTLKNLKRLDISRNSFSGSLPDFSMISGLVEFTAQDNQLSGTLPRFVFSNLDVFDVSNNSFSGPVPSGYGRMPASSFKNNPGLCGTPLPDACQTTSESESVSTDEHKKKRNKRDRILMFSGYVVLALAVVLLITFWLCRKRKKTKNQVDAIDMSKPGGTHSTYFKSNSFSKSEVSKTRVDNASAVSASLVVLTSPEVNGVKFENLLKAPAELIGRGVHGSVYKVLSEELRMDVVVKRVKGWDLPGNEFKQRMRRMDRVQHPHVLPALAFYSSKQEKLLVYEYQQNGSLFKLLYGPRTVKAQTFDWSARLDMAASIASGLAFMHQELAEDGIAHGNLKSSNIMLSKNMDPYISEYGLMFDSQDPSSTGAPYSQAVFKADIYAFGVILLELLTGKLVQKEVNGMDLAGWVVSVVREEWTVEVFDKRLIQEGGNEERMVNMLQIAVKCVNHVHELRPSMAEIAQMLDAIKEDEEKSMDDLSGVTTASIFELKSA